MNCCAAYQALLQQRKDKSGTDSANELDQLDIDMTRLTSAVQAVDSMLEEIDKLLKVLFTVMFINKL